MHTLKIRSLAASFGIASLLAVLGPATVASADPIPSGWTCSGVCGSLGANGVVTLSPTGNSSYQYVTTAGSNATGALPSTTPGYVPGLETNGSILTTSTFAATPGTDLNFYFNFVTSDGSSTYADYAWAELFSTSSTTPVAVLFTAQTEPSGSIVPAPGLPTPTATLNPATVPIIPGGPAWSPLGGYSGDCFDAGCGYTGWIASDYTIGPAGTYFLEFGTTNWADTEYDTGLAVDGVTINGTPITPPSVPEPSTLVLLGSGLIGLAGAARRRLTGR
jgi:hypothetical protein